MWLTLFIVLLIPTLFFLYTHFSRELKEIDPGLLNHQTSISETRKSNESAIYRSVDVPHGVTVTRGLNLRSGYKIRDGCLKDIWHLALINRNDKLNNTNIKLGKYEFSIGQINNIIHLIANKLKEIENIKNIAIYGNLIDNPELLLVIWSCFFITDNTIIMCNSSNDLKIAHNQECNIVFTVPSNIKEISNNKILNTVGINIDRNNEYDGFSYIINIDSNIEIKTDYDYDSNKDFNNVNNHPYSVINNGYEMKFFQINFVSAIASKLMSIPNFLKFLETDNLLISYTNKDFYSTKIIFGSLCGLLTEIEKIQIINPNKIKTLKELAKYEPTILFIDSNILKTICSSTKKTFWQSFKLQRSEYFNSLGYFNSFGKIEKSLNLKLVFTCQLSPILSSFICNFCKSVLGCRIIREIYTNYSIGPILKTNIYDFRVIQNRSLPLLGVPANSVELKTINSSEDEIHGKLYCRGMSIGKGEHIHADENEFWVNTGIEGTFARDGCFYGKF